MYGDITRPNIDKLYKKREINYILIVRKIKFYTIQVSRSKKDSRSLWNIIREGITANKSKVIEEIFTSDLVIPKVREDMAEAFNEFYSKVHETHAKNW